MHYCMTMRYKLHITLSQKIKKQFFICCSVSHQSEAYVEFKSRTFVLLLFVCLFVCLLLLLLLILFFETRYTIFSYWLQDGHAANVCGLIYFLYENIHLLKSKTIEPNIRLFDAFSMVIANGRENARLLSFFSFLLHLCPFSFSFLSYEK